MKIGIASDHRGYDLKNKIINKLEEKNLKIVDYGTDSKLVTDYPKYAFLLSEGLKKGEITYGIAICGTGIGISIACNKVKGIRCAKVSSKADATLSRLHNDANVIALSAKLNINKSMKLIETFLNTGFSQETRHVKRIEQITKYEEENNDR